MMKKDLTSRKLKFIVIPKSNLGGNMKHILLDPDILRVQIPYPKNNDVAMEQCANLGELLRERYPELQTPLTESVNKPRYIVELKEFERMGSVLELTYHGYWVSLGLENQSAPAA